jgi:hypothetical protein
MLASRERFLAELKTKPKAPEQASAAFGRDPPRNQRFSRICLRDHQIFAKACLSEIGSMGFKLFKYRNHCTYYALGRV